MDINDESHKAISGADEEGPREKRRDPVEAAAVGPNHDFHDRSLTPMALNLQDIPTYLSNSASKYHVPVDILTGVIGMETAGGKLDKTSSAGAMGLMQFIPSTAKLYNYPLTNSPTPAQAQQQIDAGAHYLSDLYRQHGGNWDAALRAYSGKGYGLSQVQAAAKGSQGSSLLQQAGNAASSLLPSIDPLSGVAGAITGAWNALVNNVKYAAVLVAVLALGAFLIFHGVSGVTSGGNRQPRPISVPV